MNTNTTVANKAKTKPKTRDEIRAQILGANNSHLEVEPLTLFGAEVELKTPSLREVLDAQNDSDRTRGAALMIIRYCFVPGTSTRVFDEADIDGILALPFGKDMVKAQEAITRLTGIDVSGEVEKLKKDPTGGTSKS